MSHFWLSRHFQPHLPPSPRKTQPRLPKFSHNSYFWLALLASVTLIRILCSNWNPNDSPYSLVSDLFPGSNFSNSLLPAYDFSNSLLPIHEFSPNLTEEERDFWKQPDDLGFRPCLKFSKDYKDESIAVVRERRRFLMVVVSGGLNQQRNQIVDAVVIARILEAALVVPILQVNEIWGDESEFGDIFDVEHFKTCLKDDVRIVSSLPSTHLMSKPVEEKRTPLHVSPRWIRSRYLGQLSKQGVLLMRGLDSRLSKDLPPDLQKLRCKVAFEALRFAAPIQNIGNKVAQRMWKAGPYIALHLRLEKDVWVRTGCLPGLAPHYDQIVQHERKTHPHLLTARSTMTYYERNIAGLCPLNAMEVARFLKALGVSQKSHIYWAGGNPLGGKVALEALAKQFPNLYNKESVAQAGELEAFSSSPSHLAAIDYIVALNSDVFMASHGGNMGRAIQGHRAYRGLRKSITPNKRRILPYLQDMTLSEGELKSIVRRVHNESLSSNRPHLRTDKAGSDVLAYPIPDCMCNTIT